mmetsp:Transcript_3097/g.4296  ORF Transcript_3097/g.4296 Transcript_3097/m.4296 type:complete len:233 (-) Transcript_3097:20-718(-)
MMPISVVICGTTDLLAAIVRDRFMRCLHRLRSLYLYHQATAFSRCSVCERIPGIGVIPGAGLPELLTAIQLRQLALDLEIYSCDTDHDSESLKQFIDMDVFVVENAALIATLLRNMSSAMMAYPRAVLLNNGYSCPQAELQIDRSFSALSAMCRGHKSRKDTDSVDVLQMLRNLSNVEKVSLPAPIVLDFDDCSSVKSVTSVASFDVLVIKRSAMQSALSAITQICNIVADI